MLMIYQNISCITDATGSQGKADPILGEGKVMVTSKYAPTQS